MQIAWVLAPHLLFVVIVVGAGEQVAKDELRHVHTLLLVHLYWNTTAVVPHLDGVALLRSGTHTAQCS